MHACTTYALKQLVLVNLSAACQRFKATFKNYMLKSRLIYLCITNALTLHFRVRLLQPIKEVELPPQGKL